ncbi:GNAT family N-acetyltransferase [Actinopolymorpha cephalotaxi]|uniref:Ribosomal protein S18 acetylase RimI-like enzyme n=1 Tax=Actinopolymorpha cephalotaxi TaxID=504797 RepID=A0ABX2SDM1_9ACTN|nr:GNAT family N-acetyltransferase [Actinopolymorpha cephalotaxi]NYH86189.1 ribosomal protein S18 acetylase RimI-like enzyme [Actinopolymorpha cephalotaxi]
MTTVEIAVATPADRDRVIGSLVAAFSGDPVLRYLFPDEDTYPTYAGAFFGDLFDRRVHSRTIWTIGGASVAMWQPPSIGTGPADPLGTAGDESGDQAGDNLEARLPADVWARVRTYDEAVHVALPTTPFWYLGVLGTHPDSAGRGFGHAVMNAGLRRAAADGLPAVLETSNPANVEMYRRAGWQVTHTVDEPLPIWVMTQLPR